MKPGRECTTCGKVLADRYKLYHHNIYVNNWRFCWFCDHEEGRPPRLWKHVERKHPGVAVDAMTNKELWRLADDAIIPAPEAMIVVPVPSALPPEAEVELGEVAAEVELGEVAAEAVVDETSADGAVKEVET